MDDLLKFHQSKWHTSSSSPPEDIDEYVEHFRQIDEMTPSGMGFFVLINLKTYQYEFVGKDQYSVSGFDNETVRAQGIQFQMERIHPEDAAFVIKEVYPTFDQILTDAEPRDVPNLRLQCNYRFKHKNESYIHVVERIWPLMMDKEGEKKLILSQIYQVPLISPFTVTARIEHLDPAEHVNRILYEHEYTPAHACDPAITRREIEIIKLIGKGMRSKEIAETLGISFNTVQTHRRNILKKLNLKGTADLIAYAVANHIN